MNSSELRLKEVLDEYSHLDLTLDVVQEESNQMGGGGFSDVFRSKMRPGWQARTDPYIEQLLDEARSYVDISKSDPDCVVVAVKRLRFWGKPIVRVEKAILKELKIWTRLSHPNVLPILGYIRNWTDSMYPSFVSPWMENGTLRTYLVEHDVDALIMASGIASGLQYLHFQQVVHADLKCENVLLSPTLQPLLTDFGLSRQIIASISTSTTISGGSLRWKAPELASEGEVNANEKSDIWALGMTLLELITKDIPYSGMTDMQVIRSLLNGSLPPLPNDLAQRSLTDLRLWSVCQECWATDTSKRPDVTMVRRRLSQVRVEGVTELAQILDIYPHLNLTNLVPSDADDFFLPISRFEVRSYLQNKQNVTSQNPWGEINFPPVSGVPSDCVLVEVRRLRPWNLRPEPRVVTNELATLAELSHPNVLPFLGYIYGSDEQFSIVFPHIEIGMILHFYLQSHRVEILPMAEVIASGLTYLHERGVVCSILSTFNVILSPALRPLIKVSELWLSQEDSGISPNKYQEIFRTHCRWMAMEMFDDRRIGHTNQGTDIWAFGMTILELYVKDRPYGLLTDDIVINNLRNRFLPPPPDDIRELSKAEQDLWALCQECWNFEPSERPTAQGILSRIHGIMGDFPLDSGIDSETWLEVQ